MFVVIDGGSLSRQTPCLTEANLTPGGGRRLGDKDNVWGLYLRILSDRIQT